MSKTQYCTEKENAKEKANRREENDKERKRQRNVQNQTLYFVVCLWQGLTTFYSGFAVVISPHNIIN